METVDAKIACDFCDAAVTHERFELEGSKGAGQQVATNFHYILCRGCYQKVNHSLTTILQTILREETAKLKQELRAAGWKI